MCGGGGGGEEKYWISSCLDIICVCGGGGGGEVLDLIMFGYNMCVCGGGGRRSIGSHHVWI